MKKLIGLGCAAMSALGCLGQTKLPNVILLLADDLGYNDISSYRESNFETIVKGSSTSNTPNIDKLAKDGICFDNFYSGASVSSPSRAALITGRNSTRLGIYNWIPKDSPMHLRYSEITLAELLKSKGYGAGHFGKWHLSRYGENQPQPLDQGFDHGFYTYLNADPSHYNPQTYYRNGKPLGKLDGYACDLVVEEAINWIKLNKDKPFFANIWFNEPHAVAAAPEEFKKNHSNRHAYYGSIENMDRAIGRLMSYLKENDLENTIVIFSSDNGSPVDGSNEPFRLGKCFSYEGGIRVPFMVKWKDHIPSAQISNFNGIFEDVYSTVASIVNIPLPKDRKYDGVDISSVLYGKENELDRKEPIFFFTYFHDPVCMIREGDWCLLGFHDEIPDVSEESLPMSRLRVKRVKVSPWSFTKEHMDKVYEISPKYFELYNMKEDKEQNNNLIEKYPKKAKKMKEKMMSTMKEVIEEGGNWY